MIVYGWLVSFVLLFLLAAVSAPLPSSAPPLSGLATGIETAGLWLLWWSCFDYSEEEKIKNPFDSKSNKN